MFQPKVSNPKLSVHIPQMLSDGFQRKHYFGGSQVPVALMPPATFSGKGIHRDKMFLPSHKGIQKM